MKKIFRKTVLALLPAALGCILIEHHFWPPGAAQTNHIVLQLEPFQSGLQAPVYLTSARDGSRRLFILEQSGRIRVLQPGAAGSTVFLDITARVLSGGERGLLGLAFHPQFKTNRRFFVNYTRRNDGATVVAEYLASANNPNQAETTERVLLTVAQPFPNHNGGMIEFGPDGFLYIGMGDGGNGNDPDNRAQNIEDLLGKMLRIDVDTPNGTQPYSAPATNPFFGATPGRDEIYAVGLRNPWRWSFDRLTGELYCGDVGQNAVEEIDIIKLGENYGWRVLEGTRCTNLGPGSCNDQRFIPPIYQYQHVGAGCSGSVTGGYVYRGTAGTLTPGAYVFADYCFGTIQVLESGSVRTVLDTGLGITSFGEDEAGEIYVCDGGGRIFRLINAAPGALANVSAASYRADALAPESIVAAFGTRLATGTQAATATPLPTALQETRVSVRDAVGMERLAPLFFVSPTQVNYQLPFGTALGQARVTISNREGLVSLQTINVTRLSPALFTLNASGRGLPAAVVVRTGPSGGQTVEPIARVNPATNQLEAVPIDLSQGSVVLVLFGTGFRAVGAQTAASATIGGINAPVGFAGAQGQLIGVDQANLSLPGALAGRGEVDVALMIDGQMANTVRVNVK